MKVVLWGHKPVGGRNKWGWKLRPHTHSYIHYGYFKAFSNLGYETFWFDNNDDVSAFNFSNCLFLTEGQVDQGIPLIQESVYVLHHCDNEKYITNKCKILNLCNYVADCEKGISFNYEGKSVERVGNLQFYDNSSKAFYQPWASDLLPQEIDITNVSAFDANRRNVNYVGTIRHDNIKPKMLEFAKACKHNKKQLNIQGNISHEDNCKLIRDSYISVDIRGDWHLLRGYIPCRVWKNISYGKLVGTNSKHLSDVFGDMVAFSENPYDLFHVCEERYRNLNIVEFQNTMKFVRDNHTYVNRIQNLLKMI